MDNPLEGKTILLTGGTGSFGRAFTKLVLEKYSPKVIRVFSRDELKQSEMQREFNDNRLRFLLGDTRDSTRLNRAMQNIDIVVHAAALKRIEFSEYNPFEFISTNVIGAQNIVNSAIDNHVEKIIAISNDKACEPANLYGATKCCMEHIMVQGNVYAKQQTKISCVRYGNVFNSRGSVVELFRTQAKTGTITITDERMTRFWITLEQGVNFVISCLSMMRGGEIFIPKIPSMKVTDLAEVIAPNSKKQVIGIRPGEKLHETLISENEARHTKKVEDCYVIEPEFPFWTEDTYLDLTDGKLPEGFRYSSNTNNEWLSKDNLKELIK